MSNPEEPIYSKADLTSLLAFIGKSITLIFIPLIVQMGLYGVFFALSINSLYIQWNKHRSTPSAPNLITILVVLVIFACLTIYISANLFVLFKSMYIMFNSKSNLVSPLIGAVAESEAATRNVQYAYMVMLVIVVWIADAVVVWRACVIWAYDIKAVALLGIGVLFTLASSIWSLVASHIVLSYSDNMLSSQYLSASKKESLAVVVRLLASLCTNLLATLLIACKFWSYRKHILPYIRQTSGESHAPVYTVLTYMVEMGLFLGIYQLCITTYGFNPSQDQSPKFAAYNTLYTALPFIAGINPVLTILLVNNHHSIADTTVKGEGGEIRYPPPRHMEASQLVFQHGAPSSTTRDMNTA